VDKGFQLNRAKIDFGELRLELKEAPCLSIRQPWAELILSKRKRVELRKWSTRHRGWTWLHTGKTVDEAACATFGISSVFTGGVVGVFRLRDVVSLDIERWEAWRPAHLDAGGYMLDAFGWVIAQVARLKQPIVALGSTGLFQLESSVVEKLLEEPFVGEFEDR
jgi:hypothetical protein